MTDFQHGDEVFNHLMRLFVDRFRIRRIVGRTRERHLTGHENPSIGLNRMAERGDRIRRAAYQMKAKRGHAGTLWVGSRLGLRLAEMCDNFRARSRKASDLGSDT